MQDYPMAVVESEGKRYVKARAELTSSSLMAWHRKTGELLVNITLPLGASTMTEGAWTYYGESTKVRQVTGCKCGGTRIENL